VVRVGDCIRLDPGPSASVSEEFAAHGRLARLASIAERARIKLRAAKSTFYNLRNHPDRPRLIANNVALWRRDYQRVNGFDQSYVGWGAEDDDFGFRLRRAGLQLRTILWWTTCYHLWHPRDPSAPVGRTGGDNYSYLRRGFHLIKCCDGLMKRTWQEISLAAAGPLPTGNMLRQVFPVARPRFVADGPAEVEVLFTPGPGSFTGRSQSNILVALDNSAESLLAAPEAHLVLSNEPLPGVLPERQFRLSQWEAAMNYLMFNSSPTEQPQNLQLPLAA